MDGAMIASPHHEKESFDFRCSNNSISLRNSKWLQQNMTDLEAKVKEVVTLIEEDASSFNRKAEMYFRKRPVLMRLIEELYRAYRALAERYNYTNGELEWANQAMKKTFPTKDLFGLIEDSPSSSSTNLYIEPNDVVTKENEVRNLNKALVTTRGEKEDILLKYQKTMKKLSDLEEELNLAKMSSKGLSEQESEAKTEVQRLKEAIDKVEVERDAAFLHQKDLIRRISILEPRILQVREVGLNEEASRVEIRSKCLKNEVSKLETEKETSFFRYKMCLEKIADLERRTSLSEHEAVLLHKRAHRAETEEKKLKNDLDELNKEKKLAAIEYDHCLEKVSNLESELSCAEDEMRRISNEVLIETEKLNSADDRCAMLEISNSSIKSEAAILELNIAMKEKELSNKHEELEKLLARVQEERLRFVKVEAATLTLQNFQSQEENGSLEIREVVQILKEFDISQDGIGKEKEIINSLEDLQSGHFKLKGIKEKIEEEVVVQKDIANTLQEHINVLEEDIKGTKDRYRSLMKKIKSLGLNPECVGSSIKDLKDENSKLRQTYKENKEALSNEFDSMEQLSKENTAMENSLQWLDEDKIALESQLRTIINYVEKLTEKNTVLENPLYVADIELESRKKKSEDLEEIFESLENEKFDPVDERSKLIVSLDNVKNRLGSLENKFSEAERKCRIMEKEREPTLAQVEEVKFSLGLEKRERSSLETSSEARLSSLEKHLHFLQQEIKWSKKDFEEEVDRAVYAHFEIFILHKTIQDLEMKNRSLLMKCDKHAQSSKLREDLVLELERENLEQQVEIELLISEIEKLRADTFHVFKALGFSPGNRLENIIENIVGMKRSLSSYVDDKQKLLVENSILLTLLGQVSIEGTEIANDKRILNKEFEKVTEQLMIEQNYKLESIEMNTQLKSEIKKEKQNNDTLKAEMERLCVHQRDMERDYLMLKEEHCQTLEDNSCLMKKIIDLKNEKCVLEEENDSIIAETLVLGNKCTFFKNFVTEKDMEIDSISKELQNLRMVNGDLEQEVCLLKERTEMEKLCLKDSIKKIEKEIHEVKDLNTQLRVGISDEMKIICQKEMEVCLAKEKIKATEDLNLELRKNLEELRIKFKETEIMKGNAEKENIELFEQNKNRGDEIIFLRETNENLSLEINEKKNEFQHLNNQFDIEISTKTVMLCQKDIESSLSEEDLKSKHEETIVVKKRLEKEIIELREENEKKTEEFRFLRETNENLNLELEEMKKECRVWEDEASAYFFYLQISKAYEVVLDNKVRELSSVCETLGNESCSKSIEMEKMKERVESMESNIGCFKAQLSSYASAIDSIQENMESLEHKVLGQPKPEVDQKNESKDVTEPKNQVKEHIPAIPNRLEELHNLQTRIKLLGINAQFPRKTGTKMGESEAKTELSLKDQGNSLFKAGNYLKAAVIYTQAIKQDPSNATLYSNRAAAFLNLVKLSKALADAETTITLNPTWEKGYFRKGCVLEAMERYDDALAAFQIALQYNPQSSEVSKKIKRLSQLAKDKERAQEVEKMRSNIDMSKHLSTLKTEMSAKYGADDLRNEMFSFLVETIETAIKTWHETSKVDPRVHFLLDKEKTQTEKYAPVVNVDKAFESPETHGSCIQFLRQYAEDSFSHAACLVAPKSIISYPQVWKGQGSRKWKHGQSDGFFVQFESPRLQKMWFISSSTEKGKILCRDPVALDINAHELVPRLFK